MLPMPRDESMTTRSTGPSPVTHEARDTGRSKSRGKNSSKGQKIERTKILSLGPQLAAFTLGLTDLTG